MKELVLLETPLAGTNLIEASAGTGKTYTITALMLRLIVEREMPVGDILVVTYTEAATSELKDRIRKRLREAADAFAEGTSQDEFLRRLIENCIDPAKARRRLDAAVNDFDQASIFTIHGFCLRALIDHAFASGVLFDTELVTDEEDLQREIAQDFWRTHVYKASELFYDYAIGQKFNISSLRSLVNKNLFNPFLKIVPPATAVDCSAQEESFRKILDATAELWRREKAGIEELLMSSDSLKRNMYKQTSIQAWLESIEAYLAGGTVSCVPCDCFSRFTTCGLDGALKKGCARPSHPFFDSCDRLSKASVELCGTYNEQILALKVEFLRYLRQELARRKNAKNILFFDDLLIRLHEALNGPGGDYLAEVIGGKYKAALIDEFQDTDTVQYDIFRKVFDRAGSALFLIGDPKQAIYSFRGADIFAYKKAKDLAPEDSQFTLSENWRSTPTLVEAVNAIFSGTSGDFGPFAFDFIAYPPARAAAAKEPVFFSLGGKVPPPLEITFLGSSEKPVSKDDARNAITESTASEIARLVRLGREGAALIGDAPVREGDIAVLVRKNSDARQMQQELLSRGIHSVLFNIDNLFDSREAAEIGRVLAAIAAPSDPGLLKAALTTDMLGLSGEELLLLSSDEIQWEVRLEKFAQYHETWSRHGFFRMFREFLSREEVLSRLMSYPDGERRATNVLHLAEVLHQSEVENSFNMSGLLKWLATRRDRNTPRTEEYQLRLESDENAVKLITIHKSKGLEYPIVFCPFAWEGSELRPGPFLFHDGFDEDRPVLDLGSPARAANEVAAGREQLAENLRLLYVALTRAKNMCRLAWGRISGAGTSAPAYLLHPSISSGWDGTLASLKSKFEETNDGVLWKELKALEAKSGGAISVSVMQTGVEEKLPAVAGEVSRLSCRHFEGQIDRSWKIASFSSLVSEQHQKVEARDRDRLTDDEAGSDVSPGEAPEKKHEYTIFTLPRGAVTGTLVHGILQSVDFAADDEGKVEEIVSQQVESYGYDAEWIRPFGEIVRNVSSVRLQSDFGDFALSEIPAAERLSEVEFYYPLKRMNEFQVRKVLAGCIGSPLAGMPSNMGRLRFEPLNGFMRGFIDLVFRVNGRFYLIDWKSNYLGSRVQDYAPDALKKSVEESFYNLQYHLYTVALHQYLKTRIPDYSYETHFGEVLYIFLRGIDPGSGSDYGVFRDRPSQASVEALCSQLIG